MRRFPFLPLCLSSFALTVAFCLPTVARAAAPQTATVLLRG